jgi:ribosome-associated protein
VRSYTINLKKRAVKAAELAIDKKAKDTVVLELKDLSSIADYFVICSGENQAQIKAIAESIDEYFSKNKIHPLGREGMDSAKWVLIWKSSGLMHRGCLLKKNNSLQSFAAHAYIQRT